MMQYLHEYIEAFSDEQLQPVVSVSQVVLSLTVVLLVVSHHVESWHAS